MKINPSVLTHLALFTVSLIYGANYTIAKEVMPKYFSPSATILMRILGAGILFWLLVGNKTLKLANRKERLILLLSAFFGIATNQLLFFEGFGVRIGYFTVILGYCHYLLFCSCNT